MTSAPPQPARRRVAITGLGMVTPVGIGVSESWPALVEGKSGVGPITRFDATECACRIAAEVRNFDITEERWNLKPKPGTEIKAAASRKDVRKLGMFTQFAYFAALEAYTDSGLDPLRADIPPERFGSSIGVGIGDLGGIENQQDDYVKKGFKRISPFFIPKVIANMAAGNLSILLNLRGPNVCNVTACTSSAHAVGEATEMIIRGDADLMLAGGAEMTTTPLGVGGFASMKALSTRNDAPEKASRPFDQARDGFVLGEGSAVLILEELEHAKKRRAKIYGEVCGYGLSADAYHMTSPSPEGEGGARAMQMAMRKAGLKPEQIGYVNAHGTSTPAGDAEEAVAIKKIFPNGPEHLHVSSTKSMTGHLLGAAGAVEAAICTLAVHHGVVPPTINLDNLDPKCASLGLNYTANKAVKKNMDFALSNSFGFGGTNGSLIVGRV